MAHLLVIANKRYHSDFRKYLMRAAERAGCHALHMYCWEKVVLSRSGGEYRIFDNSVPIRTLQDEISEVFRGESYLALTGLGCNEQPVATRLQQQERNGTFIYDVYDDLLFDSRGFDRLTRMAQDCLWRMRCDIHILLNSSLLPRYPGAYHLDNASHMTSVGRGFGASRQRCVYVGSIDARVDFDWLDACARTGAGISIFGRIHAGSADISNTLADFVQRHDNVEYLGEYDNDDLWSILRDYSIGLLPYKIGHRMTEFVNPDKLYHYLNSGMEVIASPMPQLQRHASYIHAIETDGSWTDVIPQVVKARRAADWPAYEFSWDRRWSQLAEIGSYGPGWSDVDPRVLEGAAQ